MSKISELDAAVRELHSCAEALIAVSEALRECFSTGDPGHEKEASPEEPTVPVVAFEQLRGTLAEKTVAGKRAEVQALIHKYGAEKLSEVDKSHYPAMLAEAEAL